MKAFIVTFSVPDFKSNRISASVKKAIIVAENDSRMRKVLKSRGIDPSNLLFTEQHPVDQEYFRELA